MTMSPSPFSTTCDRCGEKFRPDEADRIFEVQYETMGYVSKETGKDEPKNAWRTLYLCPSCQHDLRNEFYQRGLMHHDT